MELEPGSTLRGRYLIDARLGPNTWKATDSARGGALACRRYEVGGAALESFQEALDRRRALSIAGIPRVVDVVAEARGAGAVYFVLLEWVVGRSLEDRIVDRGPLSWETSAELGRRVLEVLLGLHRHEPWQVHGDLTPSHILEDGDGEIWLVGLGELKAAAKGGRWGAAVDPAYAAPETSLGEPNPRSDLYSFGGVLLYLILGESTDIGRDPSASLKRAGVPPAFRAIFDRLLDPLAARRYGDAEALFQALGSGEVAPSVEEEEEEDDASTVLARNPGWLAEHLERLLPFVPEEFRAVALAVVLGAVLLIGVVTLGLALQLRGGAPSELVTKGPREAPERAQELIQPLSCPGAMKFSQDQGVVVCEDEQGPMRMIPGVVGGASPFLVDPHELTVARYERCREVGACSPRPPDCASEPDQPANCLTLDQAIAVCRQQRRRLCAPEEFDWLAAGTEGRARPWGDAPTTCERAVGAGCSEGPLPAGRPSGASQHGAEDVVGNLAEWLDGGQAGGGHFATPLDQLDGGLRTTTEQAAPAWLGVRCCRSLD